MFYPDIKRFAVHLERRSNTTIARTVVAKELARIVYYVLARQQPFETFKGIRVTKRYDWPSRQSRDKPVLHNWSPDTSGSPRLLIGMQVCRSTSLSTRRVVDR